MCFCKAPWDGELVGVGLAAGRKRHLNDELGRSIERLTVVSILPDGYEYPECTFCQFLSERCADGDRVLTEFCGGKIEAASELGMDRSVVLANLTCSFNHQGTNTWQFA